MPRHAILCTLFAATLATACGGSDSASPTASAPSASSAAPTPPTTPTPTPTPSGSDGCGQTPPTTTSLLVTEVRDGGGNARQFKLIVSPAYERNQRAPLVIAFHGRGGHIDQSEAFQFQTAIANAGDAGIVLLPQGLVIPGWGEGWNEGSCTSNDMAFVTAMIDYTAKHFCVDKSRVFTTGFSWGSDMTNATACCLGAQLKGVAPFSGPEGLLPSCPTPLARWPAARYWYGALDTAYDGSTSTQAQHAATLASYASKLSCSASTTPASPSNCRTYTGCRAALMECKDPSAGHVSPGLTEATDTWKFWQSLP